MPERDKREASQPIELGIVTKRGGFIYDPQIQFDRIRELLRAGGENLNVRNTLFDLNNWLAALIQSMKPKDGFTMPTEKDMATLDGLLEEMDSDEFSPKTKITYTDSRYSLQWDSYKAQSTEPALPHILEQNNREREEVTIRKLWAIHRKVTTIAYRVDTFKYHRWTVSASSEQDFLGGD